ncbi:expressed unknown protein [Seminavis robusta]|uniref:Uncharacterized protein n=1 Tax=Seminavis robusta TaxID=568900 RepID=A0A9N8EV85_9STRA|nr:expressed unknown protein [Seminavis robusta]|eukprot:Sro1789_g297630.1 n/a (221) ;mRNA; r:997-1659
MLLTTMTMLDNIRSFLQAANVSPGEFTALPGEFLLEGRRTLSAEHMPVSKDGEADLHFGILMDRNRTEYQDAFVIIEHQSGHGEEVTNNADSRRQIMTSEKTEVPVVTNLEAKEALKVQSRVTNATQTFGDANNNDDHNDIEKAYRYPNSPTSEARRKLETKSEEPSVFEQETNKIAGGNSTDTSDVDRGAKEDTFPTSRKGVQLKLRSHHEAEATEQSF